MFESKTGGDSTEIKQISNKAGSHNKATLKLNYLYEDAHHNDPIITIFNIIINAHKVKSGSLFGK